MRTACTLLLATALSSSAFAQDGVIINTGMPAGGPGAGVNVPLRVENPGDSQRLMMPDTTPPTQGGATTGGAGADVPRPGAGNPFQQALERRARARGEGEEGDGAGMRDPFHSEQFAGIGRSTRSDEILYVVGADIYRGITPNENDSVPHIARYQRRAQRGASNQLTWVGFQPFDEMSRVFIQTGRSAGHSLGQSPDGRTLTVRLPRTAIPLSNFRRPVDATFFGRAVHEIRATRGSQGEAVVTIRLARDARHNVQVQNTPSGSYIFIDFYDTMAED